jgi:hypothetical protein
VGRQLLSQLEENAAAIGAVEVHLGTVSATRGFYARLGYTGRSRMHKPLSGMGIARYGAAEERRQRLQSMRERRTNRLTHQGEPVRPGLVGAHRTGADAVTMSDPRPWPGRLDGACLPLGSAFDRRVPGHAATPAPPRRTQALGATRGDRYQRQDTSRILTLLRAVASSGSGGSWRSRAAWG